MRPDNAAWSLPPFLKAYAAAPSSVESKSYLEATLKHSVVPNTAFALWWPHAEHENAPPSPDIVILFIPGAQITLPVLPLPNLAICRKETPACWASTLRS
jgi:hypothetical protein